MVQVLALVYDGVAVVHDGRHAIDVCRRTLPDLVLMDIEMPGLDGFSAARQIAREPGERDGDILNSGRRRLSLVKHGIPKQAHAGQKTFNSRPAAPTFGVD